MFASSKTVCAEPWELPKILGQAKLSVVPELKGIEGAAPKMLHLVRSTPLLTGVLIGQKVPAHVYANTILSAANPLDEDAFLTAWNALEPYVS